MSLESGLLSAETKAHRTTTSQSASGNGAKTAHGSTYVKIGSMQSQKSLMARQGAKESDIWVRQDIEVRREDSIELKEVHQPQQEAWER